MSVYYKIYQDNREKNPNRGKWYARAAMTDTDTTATLAKTIQEKCTVNEADVLAVINALVSEITRSLQSSHRVKLDGFGTFKIGMRTKPADEREDFDASKNIKSVHILFQPETKISRLTKTRTRAFLTGLTVKELSPYNVEESDKSSKSSDSGSSASGSGSDSGSTSGSGSDSGSTGGGDQQG